MTTEAAPTSPGAGAVLSASGLAQPHANKPTTRATLSNAWVLPSGCSLVQPSDSFAVALCRPEPDTLAAKIITGIPPTLISLLALGVSLWTLKYNRTKDQRARRQSIEDDYWLRKVVSPLSIEPLLKYVNRTAANLPVATAGSTAESVRKFWAAQTRKLGELSIAFRTLGLIEAELDKEVALGIEKLEDELARYCGLLLQHLDGKLPAAPNKDDAGRTLLAITINVFQLVKNHQIKVGLTEK